MIFFKVRYILTQVVRLRRSQFVFFVEMNIMAIKERPFKISKNNYYNQS